MLVVRLLLLAVCAMRCAETLQNSGDLDTSLLTVISQQCSAVAWSTCMHDLRQCSSDKGATRVFNTHIVVLQLRVTNGTLLHTNKFANAVRMAPIRMLTFNSSDFARLRLGTELSFSVPTVNYSRVANDSLYLLVALGCVPVFRTFDHLRHSLDTINKLVQTDVVCLLLTQTSTQHNCRLLRYFAASYRLTTHAFRIGAPLDTNALVRLRRETSETDYNYGDDYNYDENATISESSGSPGSIDDVPEATERLTTVGPRPPQPQPQPQPIATTTTTYVSTSSLSSTPVATRSVVTRKLIRLDLAKRLDSLQLYVGVPPVYPLLNQLFLVGTVFGDQLDAEPDDEATAASGELLYELSLLNCANGASLCQLTRGSWLRVCGDSLCGDPPAEAVGSWRFTLTARFRDLQSGSTSASASDLLQVSVLPRSASGLPPSVVVPDPNASNNAAGFYDAVDEDETSDSLRLTRPIKNFRIYVGEVLNHQFPSDTFTDPTESSEVTYVVVSGTKERSEQLKRDSWLQFNITTRTLFALVLNNDLVGTHSFLLVASVNNGSSAVGHCPFNVTIESTPYLNSLTHHFVATFNVTFATFKQQMKNPIGVMRAFADFMGDANPGQLTATFMQPVHQFNLNPIAADVSPRRRLNNTRMLLFAWSNNSVVSDSPSSPDYPLGSSARRVPRSAQASTNTLNSCPASLIRSMLFRMLNPAQLDMLSERFVAHFSEWQLLSLKLIGVGSCSDTFPAGNLFVSRPNLPGHSLPFADERNKVLIRAMLNDRSTPKSAADASTMAVRQPLEGNELLVTIIIPSIVIALALVLSALIGCVLYQKMRQSRKRRCNVAGGRVYFKKGVPVIFAEELDEHVASAQGETPSRPLILPAEKPPLAPSDLLDCHYSIQQFSTHPASASASAASPAGTFVAVNNARSPQPQVALARPLVAQAHLQNKPMTSYAGVSYMAT